MSNSYDAIVVGAGHNGLTAAAYLGRAGLKVLVLERRDFVGGACVTEELFPGFRVSSCSYVCHLLQDKVVDDLQLYDNGLDVIPLDPFRFQPHPGGDHIFNWHDDERTRAEIERVSAADARRFPDWAAFWRSAGGLLHRYFLADPPTFAQVADEVSGTEDAAVFDRMVEGNMVDLVREYFESEAVQGAFIDAQDAGDPSAPGSIMAIAYIRCNQFTRLDHLGIPRGGMGNITQSLARSARAAGVEIRTGAHIERILTSDGRAYGIMFGGGEIIEAQTILSNADPKRTYLQMLRLGDLEPDFTAQVDGYTTNATYLKRWGSSEESVGERAGFLGRILGRLKIA